MKGSITYPGVNVGFEHPFVEQHVTHGLRYNDVNLLGNVYLFDASGYNLNASFQVVVFNQSLISMHRKKMVEDKSVWKFWNVHDSNI